MKILVAVDSFKGSLSSLEAGNAIRKGIENAEAGAEVIVRPLADGGEGTAEAITDAAHGEHVSIMVTGPLGEKVCCNYGIINEDKTAIIEMSGAAGITLIPLAKRNPMKTTTRGVGEVIADAINRGCRHFIIGIGGSATNDGGIGMLQALGFEFLDKNGNQVPYGGDGLSRINSIRTENVISMLGECDFQIACDVNNPLCGTNGSSAVFGPQKGATPDMVMKLDEALNRYAALTNLKKNTSFESCPGAGAAGGLGFAFLSYMNARLESGFTIVAKETNLEQYISEADIIITGEGRIDSQTVMGKAPIGVAALARKHSKKVIAIGGSVAADAGVCNKHGIDALFSITREPVELEDAMKPENAAANLSLTAEQIIRLIGCVNSK